MFESDCKNYHAWSHKIWLVERYEMWDDPTHIDFIDTMLDNNVRNNSVWSFRYFIINRRNRKNFSKEMVESELKYALEMRIPQDWTNEAAWAYVRGWLAASKEEASKSLDSNAKRIFIGEYDWLPAFLEEWAAYGEHSSFDEIELKGKGDEDDQESIEATAHLKYNGLKNNRFLYATLADLAIAHKQTEKAVGILENLKEIDPIR